MDWIRDWFNVYILTIKYWLQGDDWKFAKEYAEALVKGYKKN